MTDWHYKIDPGGGVTIRNLDRPDTPITLDRDVTLWLYRQLSTHPTVLAANAAERLRCSVAIGASGAKPVGKDSYTRCGTCPRCGAVTDRDNADEVVKC